MDFLFPHVTDLPQFVYYTNFVRPSHIPKSKAEPATKTLLMSPLAGPGRNALPILLPPNHRPFNSHRQNNFLYHSNCTIAAFEHDPCEHKNFLQISSEVRYNLYINEE
ncbi:uncharacterized protein LOC143260612 [Megalopta genalis]|uniref:uncharacterized protein LOC143260612 n=1 Tax=Megalopta genalis TaxID=115081 RepID=UPI003FD18E53